MDSKSIINSFFNVITDESNFTPLRGSIEITKSCNFDCVHCYLDKRVRSTISTDVIKKFISYISERGCMILQFSGGECLVNKDFSKIYLAASSLGILVDISTNGTLIDQALLDVFQSFTPNQVTISLYGASEHTYQLVTGRRGYYVKVIANIQELLKYNVNIKINIILLAQNFNELDLMVSLCDKYNLEFYIFTNLINKETGKNNDPSRINDNTILERVNFILDRKGYDSEYKRKYVENRKESFLNSGVLYPCDAGKNSFHLFSNGDLALCKLQRSHHNNIIYNNYDECFSELQVIRSEILVQNNECINCYLKCYCSSCPVKYDYMTSDNKYFCDEAKRRYNSLH